MTHIRRSVQVLSLLSVFALSACGEAYEMVPYSGTPYSNERTAGKGVEYVLARLAPKKGPVVEPEMKPADPPPAPAPAPEPVSESTPQPEPEIQDAAPIIEKMIAK